MAKQPEQVLDHLGFGHQDRVDHDQRLLGPRRLDRPAHADLDHDRRPVHLRRQRGRGRPQSIPGRRSPRGARPDPCRAPDRLGRRHPCSRRLPRLRGLRHERCRHRSAAGDHDPARRSRPHRRLRPRPAQHGEHCHSADQLYAGGKLVIVRVIRGR